MTPEDLTALLQHFRCRATCEADLQRAVEEILVQSLISFQREPMLTAKDRPDFLVGTIAVELKVDGSAIEVMRQLQRYAQHPDVAALLLVTTKNKHLAMPATLSGKPVHVVFVGRF